MAHILVIDDELVLLDLISRTLRLDGHTVTALCDPLAAMDSSREGNPPIDLLLTDVNMKPINGIELVKRLTTAGFNAPVVFMSGYPAYACLPAHADEAYTVIDKPFTTSQLRATVSSILDARRKE
jgi:DNA-binding NtrC family response regulator